MDLQYELLKEFDRVLNQCDQGGNLPNNVNIFDNPGRAEEQRNMMLGITGGLGEALPNIASRVVMSETPEVMNVALAEQNGIEPSCCLPGEVATPRPANLKLDKGVPHFLSKVYQIVDDHTTDNLVHWGLEGKSFIVQDAVTFCNVILPKYFKHGNFSSFIRQLNTYGFRKIDCDKWEFATDAFQRGQRHQLKYIKRKTSISKKMGLGSGKHDDKKHLKSLFVQISNVSQQVEVSSSLISAFEKKVQDIELKYKLLSSVLSKILQNAGFAAELLKSKEHGSDGGTETPSEQKMSERHRIAKLSSETTHLLSDLNVTAQSPNQTELQLFHYVSAPSIGESSCSPNDSLESLRNELMNGTEQCEGIGSEKRVSYFHELESLIAVDESDGGWVAYADQHVDKKPKIMSGVVQGSG